MHLACVILASVCIHRACHHLTEFAPSEWPAPQHLGSGSICTQIDTAIILSGALGAAPRKHSHSERSQPGAADAGPNTRSWQGSGVDDGKIFLVFPQKSGNRVRCDHLLIAGFGSSLEPDCLTKTWGLMSAVQTAFPRLALATKSTAPELGRYSLDSQPSTLELRSRSMLWRLTETNLILVTMYDEGPGVLRLLQHIVDRWYVGIRDTARYNFLPLRRIPDVVVGNSTTPTVLVGRSFRVHGCHTHPSFFRHCRVMIHAHVGMTVDLCQPMTSVAIIT